MKRKLFYTLLLLIPCLGVFAASAAELRRLAGASLAEFDRRAREQEPLNVVFFGGALTWGANASDPQRTSYRALFCEYLRLRYPKAPFHFVDASIGGTDSKAAMFRLERDVLSRHPDLVVIEFTAGDGLHGTDRQTLAGYERLIYDLGYAGIPVLPVLLGYKDNFEDRGRWSLPPRARDHVTLSKMYNLTPADGFSHVNRALTGGKLDLDDIWPFDDLHPDNAGYQLFFEAVREAFETSVQTGAICRLPSAPVYADLYRNRQRIQLSRFPVPDGWRPAKPYRSSMWFDSLSSRWLEEVIVCDIRAVEQAQPLVLDFRGTLVGLMGEADQDSLGFRVLIDGEVVPYSTGTGSGGMIEEVWPTDTRRFGGGRMFVWIEITDKLKPGRHTIQIVPVFPEGATRGQLRIESICVAGE
jgi:lysophospholipase L1-like esterase